MLFGCFVGANTGKEWTENFNDYKALKNTISKASVIDHMESLPVGLAGWTTEMFTGEKLRVGVIDDGEFTFPLEFIHYYKNYAIGIPYAYEDYLKKTWGLQLVD